MEGIQSISRCWWGPRVFQWPPQTPISPLQSRLMILLFSHIQGSLTCVVDDVFFQSRSQMSSAFIQGIANLTNFLSLILLYRDADKVIIKQSIILGI